MRQAAFRCTQHVLACNLLPTYMQVMQLVFACCSTCVHSIDVGVTLAAHHVSSLLVLQRPPAQSQWSAGSVQHISTMCMPSLLPTLKCMQISAADSNEQHVCCA